MRGSALSERNNSADMLVIFVLWSRGKRRISRLFFSYPQLWITLCVTFNRLLNELVGR